ncbi:glucose-1-phosphate thymidylyltransferase [bacterium]|nr:glucose-1-phosphate thymidylyltransferase [bacterium]
MKGLILSGGKGTRMRPLTYTAAKQLLPVANKPVLFYTIEMMLEAGIRDIGIVVGETKGEIIKAVGNGSRWGIKITYIEQETPAGLAHAVKVSRHFLGDEPFVMLLGDNIIKAGIKDFVEEFVKVKPDALILLSPIKNPERFGVAVIENGKIVRLLEKPFPPPSNLALVGCYIFNKNIFSACSEIKPSQRGELEITDAIQWLIDRGYDVRYHIIKGWWKDTGMADDLLEANRLILEEIEEDIRGEIDDLTKIMGKVKIGIGSKIINSVLRGPLVIGENCMIENSYIGPFTSIGNAVYIKETEIEHSIILDNCKIHLQGRIEDTILGRGVVVRKVDRRPLSYKFIVGDQSIIEVM